MRDRKYIMIIIWVFFSFVKCLAQSDLNELVASLVSKDVAESNIYEKFSNSGIETIPYLINVIDKNERGMVGFIDTKSSFIKLTLFNNYVGIRAAYMIEYILSNSNKIKLYNFCIIEKVVNDKPIEILTYNDMIEIKLIYQKWWKNNKLKSRLLLSEDWKNNKRPLTGSCYYWN